ncbi:AcrB/AcrD/AcrF family protein [Roseobacter sp. HKCCD9010]|uniref:efflux RND transporter permease subunit n=1 Tax=unclassified Roseobacter TaxID=196798 RepID=UPI001492B6C8|nr:MULTISPECIES: efflux RND transporter permease subunit [unclassified Roseobacter]MBF9048816.1 AcrB/AcrD/AcrF family protein [Rhodobacterales bacterium HKCCD4356]NNV10815.1 AcrB/AcrD/AcrF family protein [Roseobacter sp. HKCCD7357]NNV15000.1 AcrB/AcrD/AcrF family protein [Roseobacter sp. HKCCD8768]NNV24459.1 AcrB/AcrD/AcrF family protein [Roseobacter sp. HKCCD8192]NNV28716.1 AcrB/AcrD/AcrF family protein [Roseobacter sp. HKCCD9061]
MNIARGSINRPIIIWILILTCLFGGTWGFLSLGRLEDPAFTIKTAVVITQYPGASAEQVMTEVSEPLESAIQRMGEVDRITSINQPGLSRIEVEIQSTFDGTELPAIWTDLRNNVADAARHLPDGVSQPQVNDGFGDVFGIFFAVSAEGYTDAERHELAQFLRRELLSVEGVADVDVQGLPDEAIFVEPEMALAAHQNISPQTFINALASANSVASAGSIDQATTHTLIQAPEGSDSVSDIAGLTVGVGGEVLNLIDIAQVSRGRQDEPSILIRYNGVEAFTLGVAGLADENIVDVGHAVDARLAELQTEIPYGVILHPIYQQHVVVDEASSDFLLNLAMSVGIVVLVLGLFMGPRAAIVVGSTLLLTVVGTLLFMAIFSIEMERISLGALIIAMGMLVDNAIVVAEGMQIAMRRGKSSRDAADEAAGKTQIPLLGATVIGIMAFAGIGLSPDATGEFLFSLFAVIGISLMLSWVLALTVTPLLGHYFFKQGEVGGDDAYSGPLFRAYGAVLGLALRARWLVVMLLLVVTVACYWGFGQVKQQFFPNSNTPIFFVHYKLPQGTPITTTAEHMAVFEDWLAEREEVTSVATFVGQGATRFMLTYQAESQNPSYGHLIIRAASLDLIPALQADIEAYAAEVLPQGEFRTARLVFGPGGGDPIQVRFSGSDPEVLRDLADEAMATLQETSPNILAPRTNWREQELVLRPNYATERAQTAGITRDNIAQIFAFATDGITAGTYRENDRLIPIIVRVPESAQLSVMDQVVETAGGTLMPVEQVIDGMAFEPQNTLIHRRNRVPTITVGASIPTDLTAAQVHAEIREAIEAIELPLGYRMEWGGEFENSADANASLAQQLPLSLLIMVLISVLLFNALRQPLIIWLLVPMSVNGVTLGLLGTGLPFTFTALLGLLSLSGMLIKNGIVLVEEIDLVRADGLPLREAIVTASTSRLRPVVLAAATTILGMAPLLSDAFFVSMAVTIMGGLAFASILTLVAAPVFYDLLFARSERRAKASEPGNTAAAEPV